MNRVNCDNRKERACTWHSSYISCFTSSVGSPRCGTPCAAGSAYRTPVVGHRRGIGLRAPAGVLHPQELERNRDGREDV